MKRTFTIPVKPYSTNKFYYSNRAIIRTEAREWIASICDHIDRCPENSKSASDLRNEYDPKKSYFEVEIIHYIPYSEFMTKDGRLKKPDVSNIEKHLIDVLFDKKYFNKSPPFGCKNINHDDKYIKKMSSEKEASEDDEYSIKFTVEVKPHNLSFYKKLLDSLIHNN